MADDAISGQYGSITGVGTVMQWSIARTRPSNAFKHSGTGGGTNRRKGVGAWTGSWTAKGGLPAVMPGLSTAFVGFAGPSSGVKGTDGFRYSGTVFVTDVTIEWDWSTNAVLSHTCNFVGHLGLTRATGVTIDDVSTVAEQTSSACIMEHSAVSISSMKTASLKISSEIKSYVNSDTGNETGRRGSGLIDWEAAFVIERTDVTLTEGVQGVLKMYTSASLFYLLTYSRFREYSGITVNHETGDIISQTATFEMASNDETAGTVGSIVVPGGATYWP